MKKYSFILVSLLIIGSYARTSFGNGSLEANVSIKSTVNLAGPIDSTKNTTLANLVLSDKKKRTLSFKPSPLVDFDSYLTLAKEVQKLRDNRLVSLDSFLALSRESNVVILDTRSDSLFRNKHLKGAIHLNFSDFTQDALNTLIPDTSTRILIYCNNNFKDQTEDFFEIDPAYFASKVTRPREIKLRVQKPLTLALNVPTFINLVGYGFRNVFELGEQVNVSDARLEFEGNAVSKSN